nr:hypothetical protein CFP56_69642 [Quercus suber]
MAPDRTVTAPTQHMPTALDYIVLRFVRVRTISNDFSLRARAECTMKSLTAFHRSLTTREKMTIIVRRRRAQNQSNNVPVLGDSEDPNRPMDEQIQRYWQEVVAEDFKFCRREAEKLINKFLSWTNPGARFEYFDRPLEEWMERCHEGQTELESRHRDVFLEDVFTSLHDHLSRKPKKLTTLQAEELYEAVRSKAPMTLTNTADPQLNVWLLARRRIMVEARRRRDYRRAHQVGSKATLKSCKDHRQRLRCNLSFAIWSVRISLDSNTNIISSEELFRHVNHGRKDLEPAGDESTIHQSCSLM